MRSPLKVKFLVIVWCRRTRVDSSTSFHSPFQWRSQQTYSDVCRLFTWHGLDV